MDYDDKEFASRNTQLVGEEDSKFPPGLRSYALPKFDLDEHLQVHLRFDSLGETGILLGIANQTEEHWIEDYSREDQNILVLDPVSQGLDFGVSAEESCTISRSNNVWSEAASSESVEMLLNSVGQDEMTTDKGDTAKMDAPDILGKLDQQMNSGFCPTGTSSNARSVSSDDSTVPLDSCLQSLSSSGKDPVDDVEVIPEHHGDVSECQSLGNRDEMRNDLHESSASRPSTFLERISTAVESSQMNEVLVDDKKWPRDELLRGLVPQQAENKSQNEGPFEGDSVVDDTLHCISDFDTEITSEKLVSKQADYPATRLDTGEGAMPRDTCNELVCQELQGSPVTDNANATNGKIPEKDVESNDHPVEHKFVDNKRELLGETCLDKDDSMVVTNCGLAQTISASNIAEDVQNFSQSSDFCSVEVNTTNVEVVVHCLDPISSQKEVSGSLANSRIAKLTLVNDTSEVLMDNGPLSHGMRDNRMADIDSSGSSLKDASQQLCGNSAPDHATVLGNDTLASSVLDTSKADDVSPLGDMSVRYPQEQSEKDTIPSKLVGLEIGTSEDIVCTCLPSEGLTATSHLVSPATNGIFSENTSDIAVVNNLEDTVNQTVTEDITMSSKERVQQKEGTPDASGSGETGNRNLVASLSLEDEVNGKCQTVNTSDLASVTKEHAVHIVAAESHGLVIGHSSAPVQHSDDNVLLTRLQASGVGKGTSGDSTGIEKISVSSPLFDKETDAPVVSEVSAKGSKLSMASVTDEETGKEEQPIPPIVSVVGSAGAFCDNKHQTNEKSAHEDPPPSTGICSVGCSSDVTLINSSHSDIKTPSGVMMAPPASNSGVYNRDCLKNDVNAPKADNDVVPVDPDCGSPTVISCSEPCVSDKAWHEGEKQSLVQNCPTSGVVSCAPADVSVHTDVPKATDRTPQTPERSNVTESDKSFTFEVGKLASSVVCEKNGEAYKSFPSVQRLQPAEPLQANHKRSTERTPRSRRNPTSNEKRVIEPGKDPSTGKSRSRFGSRTERVASGKGRPAKESLSTRLMSSNAREGKNLADNSASPVGTLLSTPMQVEEGKKLAYIESSTTKSYSMKAAQTSNLSDLTTFASPTSGLFQQPFTDMQQLQLRAQIFVYGSLIQGTAPDEACMVSAFGESGGDGGRSMWETAWHLAVERSRSQKSWANSEVSPVANSGIKSNEQTPKGNSVQGKSSIISAGRAAGKGSSVSHPSPAVSMPSPTWIMATSSRDMVQANTVTRTSPVDPHTTLTPLHVLYPSPHIRPVAGHPSTWPSHLPSPVPWIFPPQASTMDGTPYATFPTPETVHATSIREHPVAASVNVTSISQPIASSPLSTAVSSAVASAGIHTEVLPTTTCGMLPSTGSKPRKRKKSTPAENSSLPYVHPFPTELGSVAVTPTKQIHVPTSVSTPTTFSFTSAVSTSRAASGEPTPSPLALSNYQICGNNPEQRAIFSKEACSRIEQAKRQAEDAAAVSASAVRHSQDIWSHLAVKRNSGLVSDVEETLASAAVAAAAAASVAKAAAAAAKVASDAALQAKLMADEALTMNKAFTGVCGTEPDTSDGMRSSGIVTASSLNGKVKQGVSSSALEFAREAARKRVEAASAATKRAQNLDAVVKAAELATEAISQATAIVAMGDPIPMTLTELLEAGPGGYWKDQDVFSSFTKKTKTMEILQLSNGARIEPNNSLYLKYSPKKDIMLGFDEGNGNASKDSSKQSTDDQRELISGACVAVPIIETTEINQKKQKLSQSINSVGSIPSSEHVSGNVSMSMQFEDFGKDEQSEASNEKSIKQGSLVEVISDEEGLRAVWFSARVLEVKDGKAYVCYNNRLSDEGPGQLKEWIPLKLDGKPPRIRIAHPMTAVKFEGTRKRRRAAMGNYNWSAGDHVDAWMRDGWWEGIIMEKSKEDESKLTVRFQAEGDARTIRAWDIRPSLIWKDSQWVEWSRDSGCWLNEQGDAPLDERQKLDRNLENDSSLDKGQENPPKIVCSASSPQELTELGLASKDTFCLGRSTAENNELASGRITRTGLQKQGSRVVFGVPKPGKKRKFMDVSKHYGAEQVGKVGDTNNMAKFSRYLMPQKTSGGTSASKDDPKGGRTTNTRSKDVLGKLQGGQSKSRSRKVIQSVSCLPPSSGSIETDQLSGQPCLTHEGNPEKQNRAEIVSDIPKAPNTSRPFSSIGRDLLPHGKKVPSAVDSRVAPKVKVAAAAERSSSGEGKLVPDLAEPRRSNRRIQPTSRLLEGLQSSLTIGKVSSSAVPDKGSKALTRSVNSSVRGNGHGLQK
ncbi:uncharacterized protein LOC116266338 [Nymphaea colorata]|nr:uncharacterized protein LOC116266338 [Nymphaea colorata]